MYIVIEGPEATGKTLQAGLLAERLINSGHEVFLTKEPGCPQDLVCQKIRSILLDKDNKVSSLSALFLFLADRAQHIDIVKQYLAKGTIVISDRSSLSSFVYHTAEKRDFVNEEEDGFLCSVLDMAQQISPNVCFVCNADPVWSMDRLKARASLDRIETFPEMFHKNTQSLFSPYNVVQISKLMKLGPQRIFATPAANKTSIADISDFIFDRIKELI